MKLIVTGGTGKIGSAVLRYCINSPAVTHIYALTRRPLAADISSSPKVTTIIHNDFSSYPDALLDKVAGASACIWSLGVTLTKGEGILENYREADVEFMPSAASAFAENLPTYLKGRRFRFIFVSGWAAERDQTKQLWIAEAARRSKGEAEQRLIDLAARKSHALEVYAARTGLVLPRETWRPNFLIWYTYTIREDQLAAALADIAMNGYERDTVYARDLSTLGMKLVG